MTTKETLKEAFESMNPEQFFNWLGGFREKAGVKDLPALRLNNSIDWCKFFMMMNKLIILSETN